VKLATLTLTPKNGYVELSMTFDGQESEGEPTLPEARDAAKRALLYALERVEKAQDGGRGRGRTTFERTLLVQKPARKG
jgi:hypothetical protein